MESQPIRYFSMSFSIVSYALIWSKVPAYTIISKNTNLIFG